MCDSLVGFVSLTLSAVVEICDTLFCSNRTKVICVGDLTQSPNVSLVITVLHVITSSLLITCSLP